MSGKIRTVIVDDHQVVRETWKMLLQSCHQIHVIKACQSGKEIIDEAMTLNPDVILMDINMTPIDGFEATRQVLNKLPTVKIIGISLNNSPSYVKNMLSSGATGYVTKNSSMDEMVTAIEAVVGGHVYICNEMKDKVKNGK